MPPDTTSTSARRWLRWTLQLAVLAAVCLGVRHTVETALAQLSQHQWSVRPGWLVIAGALYIAGLVPMAWFWGCALTALGEPAPWNATLRGYFLGHVGKYVPGKAMAVILRIAAVRRWAPSMRLAIVSVLLETLTMMTVGAFLAAGLSMCLLRGRPELSALALVVAIVVGAPTLPPVTRRLLRFGSARTTPDAADESKTIDVDARLACIDYRLLAKGWSSALACWLFLGLSLGAVLRAIGADTIDSLRDLPMLIAAAAFAVVAGFISMLPGGLGVRDLAFVEVLSPGCGAANALVAAVLIRLVWLVSELAACVILYIAARIRP